MRCNNANFKPIIDWSCAISMAFRGRTVGIPQLSESTRVQQWDNFLPPSRLRLYIFFFHSQRDESKDKRKKEKKMKRTLKVYARRHFKFFFKEVVNLKA